MKLVDASKKWRALFLAGILMLVAVSAAVAEGEYEAMPMGDEGGAAAAAIGIGVGIAALVFGLILWIFFGFCFSKIAAKTNTPNGWWGYVPILNIILMLNIVQKPWWWLLLCFIPLINVLVFCFLWWKLAEARQKPGWVGLLVFIPILGTFGVPGYLAFSD